MVSQSKVLSQSRLFMAAGALFVLWTSWNAYNYFFSTTPPALSIVGIESEGWYAGDVTCVVKGSDAYKVGEISIWLDGKQLVPKCRINKKEFDCPFAIPTKTLANGKHVLLVEAQNSTYRRAKETKELTFNVDNLSLQAAFVKGVSDAKVFQGRTLHVQFQVNKEIKQATAKSLSKSYNCFPESPNSLIYECFIPIECEQVANEYPLSIEITDKVGNTITIDNKFQVVLYPFKKQRLSIDAAKMKEENEIGLTEKQLETELEELSKKSPQQKLWQGVFYTPTDIKEQRQITTEFGVIRTTPERGLRIHKALDIYNTPRSVIWASQEGLVVLKNRYAHSGNTVVIDHGHGILSLFYHLDTFAHIEVGDRIKKGHPIGTIGKTGYATGYHLHWEMRINNIAVDPMQWTKHDF
jgi:murein DD-endopeptidase MepM/ murein hydrolase activator NlpD